MKTGSRINKTKTFENNFGSIHERAYDRYRAYESPEVRRQQLDLIYCYRIVFGIAKLNSADYFDEFSSVTNTRGYACKLYKSRCSNVKVISSLIQSLMCGTA